MIRELEKSIAKGHLLGGNSPRISNIYMEEMCKVCEEYQEDGIIILRGIFNGAEIIICKNCAYIVHSVYEINL